MRVTGCCYWLCHWLLRLLTKLLFDGNMHACNDNNVGFLFFRCVHEGEWKAGKRSGSQGFFKTPKGLVYAGQWEGGVALQASDRLNAEAKDTPLEVKIQ